METDTYYGQIGEIWEFDYVGLKVAFFGVDGSLVGK
jgi:hypothetical protein